MLTLPQELFQTVALAARDIDINTPLTLSSVNTTFRSITTSLPTLWNQLTIHFPTQRTALYLSRCGPTTPLDIDVSWPNPPEEFHEQTAIAFHIQVLFFSTLRAHRPRIRSIRVSPLDSAALHAVLARVLFALDGWDGLQRLEVGLIKEYDPQSIWTSPIMGGMLNADWSTREIKPLPITSLTLSKMNFQTWGQNVDLLFTDRIRELELVENVTLTFKELQNALKTMWESLERLVLSDVVFPSTPEQGPPTALIEALTTNDAEEFNQEDHTIEAETFAIQLPSLRELSLIRLWDADLKRIITLFDATTLVKLTVSAKASARPRMPNPEDTSGSTKTTGRSFETSSPADWAATFSHLEALIDLRIASSDLTGDCLQSLVDPGICPKLRTITLDNEFDLNSGIVKEIVQAREGAIQSVVLRGWLHKFREEDLIAIKGLVKDLRVGVIDPYDNVSVYDSDEEDVAMIDAEESESDFVSDSESAGSSDWWSDESWENEEREGEEANGLGEMYGQQPQMMGFFELVLNECRKICNVSCRRQKCVRTVFGKYHSRSTPTPNCTV